MTMIDRPVPCHPDGPRLAASTSAKPAWELRSEDFVIAVASVVSIAVAVVVMLIAILFGDFPLETDSGRPNFGNRNDWFGR